MSSRPRRRRWPSCAVSSTSDRNPRMRIATTLVALLATLALAACGSDSPKVSSSEYLDRCQSELKDRLKDQPTVKITDAQLADICKCTQDKLEAQGLGDKSIDDEELTWDKGETVGRECSVKVLTGSG